MSFTFSANSQEGYPIYNVYLFDNYYSLHPSMAGLAECSKVRLMSKQQWVSDNDNIPSIYSLSYEGKVRPKVGIGALVYLDKNGPTEQKGVHLTYAYHLYFSDNIFDDTNLLSLSLTYQGLHGTIRTDKLFGGDPSDNVLTSSNSFFQHNVGFSVSYIYSSFFSSLTVNSLFPFNEKDDNFQEETNLRNYVITLGYLLPLSETISEEPSATVFYSEATPRRHIDINTKFYYEQGNSDFYPAFTLGYRALLDDGFTSNLFSLIFTTKYRKMIFGYSYDIELGSIQKYYVSSHKFIIGFNLFCGKYDRFKKCKYLY